MNPAEPSKKLKLRLAPVMEQLQKQGVVQSVTHRQQHNRTDVIENLVQRQQEAAINRELQKLNRADIAHLLVMLPSEKRPIVWQELSPEMAGDVLVELNDPIAEDLVEITPHNRLMSILETVDIDELIEIADVLTTSQLNEAKSRLQANERQWLEQTMAYPEGTVGDNMSQNAHQPIVWGDFNQIFGDRIVQLHQYITGHFGAEFLPNDRAFFRG